MRSILGISAYYHDSAAALLRDGIIVAAAQEERFSRVKNDERFPAEAVAFLAAQLAAGAAVLSQLNPASVVVGVAALPLVALYPLAKRVTDWPQVRSRRGKRRQREGERVFEEQESKRARLNDDEKTFFSLFSLY